ncbi:hypothetical protein IC582_012954 [Cucumis melo]|uniref:Uncharacterized protein n=2 Tax=Cucumis melo TaxID=3656 RepID=A0A5A7U9W0_CUCMM|nr:uncharacterized protein LOC127143768 [Cucumis melo]KAA0052144.1 uncharacterized protein E6C27_scaffold1589G00140 [Cucumis melo var. makuwa]TYK30595.1 uncharacterized protein E5676_scaffold60158G00010 [Cucumis melo var. makuwa]
MASWKKTIISPFRKACTIFNQNPRDPKKSHSDSEQEKRVDVRNLQGEVMACGYEDVHVMWSILDHKANSAATTATATCNVSS